MGGRAGYIYLDASNSVYVGFSDGPTSSGPVPLHILTYAGNVGSPTVVAYQLSLAMVNSNPAFAANIGNLGLQYSRSGNTVGGGSWNGTISTLLIGSSYTYPELLEAGGAPMIFYIEGSVLKCIRANDANGTSWGTPQTIASGAYIGFTRSLAVANILGNPAVAFASTTGLRFVRASNSTGTIWPASTLADSQAGSCSGVSMSVISTIPSISYLAASGTTLKYSKSNDFVGTSWTSSTLDSAADNRATSVFDLGGAPAISYGKSGKVALVRATSSAATAWRTPVTIAAAEDLVFPLSGDPFCFRNISNSMPFLMRGRSVAPTISWMAQTP